MIFRRLSKNPKRDLDIGVNPKETRIYVPVEGTRMQIDDTGALNCCTTIVDGDEDYFLQLTLPYSFSVC